jgi:hypothetical protein
MTATLNGDVGKRVGAVDPPLAEDKREPFQRRALYMAIPCMPKFKE